MADLYLIKDMDMNKISSKHYSIPIDELSRNLTIYNWMCINIVLNSKYCDSVCSHREIIAVGALYEFRGAISTHVDLSFSRAFFTAWFLAGIMQTWIVLCLLLEGIRPYMEEEATSRLENPALHLTPGPGGKGGAGSLITVHLAMHATPIKVSAFYDVNGFPRLRAAVSRRDQVIDSKLKECCYYERATVPAYRARLCLLITTRDNATVLPLPERGLSCACNYAFLISSAMRW